jgi:RNA polymerase sigma factor (sigma-70 family)
VSHFDQPGARATGHADLASLALRADERFSSPKKHGLVTLNWTTTLVRPKANAMTGNAMTTSLPKVLEQLQHARGGLTDGQLLARFVASRDEDSFASLVRRHGPMVFGVCRRLLRHVHDAEDAFQATFLVLARKAGSVVKGESVGCWLYGVAYRTALEAAAANARRRARERPVMDMPHPEVAPSGAMDWKLVLDCELNRLSTVHRTAIVLCDLEGRPRQEAARLLGVPTGTLASRLDRARKVLARRLSARGVTLSAAAFAGLMAAEAASAPVPTTLVNSTTRLAALVAAGHLAAAPTSAVFLMKGVMQAMLMQKLRLAVGAFMVMAALGAAAFVCRPGEQARAQDFGQGQVTRQPASPAARPANELDELRRENADLRATVRVLLREIQELQTSHDGAPAARGGVSMPAKGSNNYNQSGKGQFTKPASGQGAEPNPQPGQQNSNAPSPEPNLEKPRSATPGQKPGNGPNPEPESSVANEMALYQGYAGAYLNKQAPGFTRPETDDISGVAKALEAALKALEESPNADGQRRAEQELEKALKQLRKHNKPETPGPNRPQ